MLASESDIGVHADRVALWRSSPYGKLWLSDDFTSPTPCLARSNSNKASTETKHKCVYPHLPLCTCMFFLNIYMVMIYLHISICIYIIIRMQQEACARSGDDELRASAFTSDDHQPPTAKKITEPFDIRLPDLSSPIVEVRPCIQVELPINYQFLPPRHVATF